MANTDQKTFQCELIGPTGKLLDCRTTSVVFPAHDGQVGILYDHMPMLSQLGLGIMKVARPAEGNHADADSRSELHFFVDGGFALVAENSLMVIAYDALALRDVSAETIESLLDKAAKNLASPTLSSIQKTHESDRMRALRRIAEAIPS